MIKRGVVFCLAVSLAACAGREPIPVSTSNALDRQMSCLELDREVGRNNASMRVLVGEDNDRTGRNIMVGAVGLLLFWPALAALDFKDAPGKEMAALDSRNDMLGELARQKNCTIQMALSSEAAKEAYESNFDEDGNPIEKTGTTREEPSPAIVPVAVTTQPQSTPVQKPPAATAQGNAGLSFLMDAFLRGEIDQAEYERRRIALGL